LAQEKEDKRISRIFEDIIAALDESTKDENAIAVLIRENKDLEKEIKAGKEKAGRICKTGRSAAAHTQPKRKLETEVDASLLISRKICERIDEITINALNASDSLSVDEAKMLEILTNIYSERSILALEEHKAGM
jgi:ABC-type branched-subunit amino acid transport system ATPase component